jgi:hypothetical protein
MVYLLLNKTSPASMQEMRISLPELGYTCWDADWEVLSQAPEGLDDKALLGWMRDGGIDVSDAKVQGEAREIVQVVTRIGSGVDVLQATKHLGSFQCNDMVFRTGSLVLALNRVAYIEIGVWCVAWLLGVHYLLRRKR